MKRATVIVVGAGGRGRTYANYIAEHPEQGKVVGVAEPIDFCRRRVIDKYAIPAEHVSTDWRDLAKRPKFADAVLICTQDAMHADPAVAFAEKGYHILLEKPMAPSADECRRIVAAVKRAGVLFAVCHVMRYSPHTAALKEILDSGAIGDIVSMQRLEPVGYWHQAHSFVRGHWRNEAEASCMLLAKSCHDLDGIRYLIGKRCKSVASFGSLKHFRTEEKPDGAADRCFNCPVEPTCAYSAKKIYLGRVERGHTGWPVGVLVNGEVSSDSVTEALRTGPYGRCVYACDNDVVDHQVVAMEFEEGVTATFTMVAFSEMRARQTRIFGTRGELRSNGSVIEVYDFLTDQTKTVDTRASAGDITGGHGGGDAGVMKAFLAAVNTGDASKIRSGPDETLESHLMVFAAEQSRLERRVVNL